MSQGTIEQRSPGAEPSREASGTLHLIGNAHLDPVWLWDWREGFQEAKATFRSALDRMNEDPEFLFTSSSAALYEFVEHNDPELFEEIRQRVAEGRWEIVGGWWIQPDCNIPSGESFVRQGLYGQRYFKEKLGVTASVGYNVDSFGHAGSLPQILAGSGMHAYVFMRPQPHEQTLPSRLFWWESNDGTRVLAFRIPYEYCTWGKELQLHVSRCAAELTGAVDEIMCFYGVGNHGGGPTRENLQSIHAMQNDPSFPRLVFSTPGRYFAAVRERAHSLPVVHDEFQHHASGCYSAHSGIKQWNRQAENALIRAEKLSALANRVVGLPYPDNFALAWKNVLFNQFHDILAGTSIEPAYEHARNQLGESLAIAYRNENNAVQAISWRVGIPGEGRRALVVFNPHAWPVRAEVQHEFGRLETDNVLLAPDGTSVPLQTVTSLATAGGRNRLSFLADVPPLGYRTYRVGCEDSPGHAPLDAGDGWIENERLRIEIDPATGGLATLLDKESGFQLIRSTAALPVVITDTSDTWSHGVLQFNTVAGQFEGTSVRLTEQGPVRATVRSESVYGRSRIVQEFTLYRGLPYVDVDVTVDWHEQFAMLKLVFPLNLYMTTPTYETAYGTIERPANGEEEPGGAWVDLTGVARNDGRILGMSIMNDAKYSYSVTEHAVNLTVLRSPIYAHHVPVEPAPDGAYSFIDQGVQRFRYRLLPHAGSWREAGTVQAAAELNSPLVPQIESCHPGPLPQEDSFITVSTPDVIIPAIKQAEDGGALVLRCLETAGRATRASITMAHWERTIEADFGPGELKTFLVPYDPDLPIRETNLLEWEK